MTTLILGLSSQEETTKHFIKAFAAHEQGHYLNFATPLLLWSILTAKRWDILNVMTGAGPLSIRETARRLKRDVKAVHADVHALLQAGVIDKTADDKILFPYDSIKVDFTLKPGINAEALVS